MSRYNYRRRETTEVKVGNAGVGGDNPVRLQSMTNTSTLDTEASARQTQRIAEAGGEIVRLTTQGVREAENMAAIGARLKELGCSVPLVADVHFNPKAAYAAAACCEKVRINPGNFVDASRGAAPRRGENETTPEQRIREALIPLIAICKEHGTALRLGVNHGSLSERIMNRYGDTPEGMAASVMEFLRECESLDFKDIVISIKASNVVVMVQTVKLLCRMMESEGMAYPLHLGVTEAGDGEDGRVKSAVGIGALLAEGIGDTIRVSLSEPPENEIPVAALLRDYIADRQCHEPIEEPANVSEQPSRDLTLPLQQPWPVLGLDYQSIPENWMEYTPGMEIKGDNPLIITSSHKNKPGHVAAIIDGLIAEGRRNPMVIKLSYPESDLDEIRVKAAADFGFLLLNGYGSAIILDAPNISEQERVSITLGILQAARLRISKTEYIACPGCGRTMFDLQNTLKQVRNATSGLKGLKIAVMGCIVNGPGEMADADYGYVGAGVGKVSIYKGKQLVYKNISPEEALPALLNLIKADGYAV